MVVIGGGAAGLSGAIALARSRRRVLVVDAGEPRNAPAGARPQLPGPRGHPAGGPARGRPRRGRPATAARSVARPGDAGRAPGRRHFRVTLDDGGATEARRLLVTTGLVDELPDVPGRGRSGGAATSCTAPTATAGRCATGRSACSRPGRCRCTRPCCGASERRRRRCSGTPAPGSADDELEQLGGPRDPRRRRRGGRAGGRRRPARRRAAGVRRGGRRATRGRGPAVHRPRGAAHRARPGTAERGGERRRRRHVVPADPMGATAVPGVWVAGNVAA